MKYAHAELTSSIIEAAVEVQRELGGGFSRDIFKCALSAELAREGIEAEVDAVVPLFYKGEAVGERRIDLSVENVVCVELAVESLATQADTDHALKYLRAAGMEAGLLLNFGPCKLDYVRLYVCGCRADVLVGSSLHHTPERKRPFSPNGAGYKIGRRAWLPKWRRRHKEPQ